MDIFYCLQQHIYFVIKMFFKKIKFNQVHIEIPKNCFYGEFSSNISFVLAKYLYINPYIIGLRIQKKISDHQFIDQIIVKNIGFINIKLKKIFWTIFLTKLLNQKFCYPILKKQSQKLNIEFVSANPTGPLHVGHVKSAVIGDSLANIYKKFGFEVVREYYINDVGNQIDLLLKSLWIRYNQIFCKEVNLKQDFYPGKYLINIAKNLFKIYGNNLNFKNDKNIIRNFVIHNVMIVIKLDLNNLNIKHDIFFSEQSMIERRIIEKSISLLNNKKFIYKGALSLPRYQDFKNIVTVKKNQILFCTHDIEDDKDRVLIKDNGQYTYFAFDIGYHKNKIDRGFDSMLVLLGADHIGYKKRLEGAVAVLSNVSLHVKICQLVKLIKGSKVLKMSKRSGNFLLINKIFSKIGIHSLRFSILQKSSSSVVEIDVDKVSKQDKNNHIFYIQYACIRAFSIISKLNGIKVHFSKLDIDTSILDEELKLIQLFTYYPKVILSCVKTSEPHKLTYYLYEIASMFHYLWNKGNVNYKYKFLCTDNMQILKTRIALVEAVIYTLTSGLNLLGIKVVDII